MSAKTAKASSAKVKYTDEPLGEVQVVPDFLPSPAELAFREEGVKVTLALSKKSIEFFKSEASKHHTQYQRMIRRLLDAYVDAQAETPRRGSRADKRRAP
ncbi:MAG: CopG family transcriptional regulator [Betaproteobacteria bacterium]|nr:CopG family transcriptional regulator [Betaproteobacteria bacterium]